AGSPLHPDFSTDPTTVFPINVVHGNSTPAADVYVNWPFTSDPGPYPIPSNAVVESSSDRHLIVFDRDNCMLYESFDTVHNANGSWTVDAISKFNLLSNAAHPPDWSTSNAAGTPQFPLLVRYDEVASGHINHAISMTGYPTANRYVWPAVHSASSKTAAPPMGTRFRLKANFDISHFSKSNQVILEALKTYGAILTDNGASWHLQGAPDPRWNNGDLHALTQIPGSAFEAVDESSLMIDPSSDAAATPIPAGWVNIVNRQSGKCLEETGTKSGDGVAQWACNGGLNQLFQFLPVSGGWMDGSTQWKESSGNGYVIVNAASGQGFDLPGSSTQNGTQIVIGPYSIATSEVWMPVPVGGGYFYLQSLLDGQVFDVPYWAGYYTNGAGVVQWPYWGGGNQQWEIVPTKR
ncbi:MAG: RICIN domain-containing protein, partial [Bryobacteraceae bacterium]